MRYSEGLSVKAVKIEGDAAGSRIRVNLARNLNERRVINGKRNTLAIDGDRTGARAGATIPRTCKDLEKALGKDAESRLVVA